LPGEGAGAAGPVRAFPSDPGPLPASNDDIAYAPVTELSRWIETRKLTAERLTQIYLDRIDRFDGKLRSVITLLRDQALERAKAADAEIAAGKYRGPLHGIPWGAKDLVNGGGRDDLRGGFEIACRQDSAVVAWARASDPRRRSVSPLALNDIWFGGQTNNPWLLEEGASGSSAGPGAATTAGCVAFALASETGGSIIAPAMRCGVAGLRPTYGRVPRSGAMTLCWSLDKIGPMTRTIEDAMLVLSAISGPDAGDVASVPAALEFDAGASVEGLRVGYFPKWMQEAPATDVDRAALDAVGRLGMTPVAVELPDWPYGSLMLILFAEAAASFEELTLSGADDTLTAQVSDAWPNLFRESRFLSAVDFVQADRMRRLVSLEMARVFSEVDVLLVPSIRDEMLTIGNFTGHPSLTLRTGFVEVTKARSDWAPDAANPLPEFSTPRRVPHGVTLLGRLFDEGTVARVGMALEREFGAWSERPAGF
jgi:Asp-tRNA(Asn)/Glu-tRNA(Gln) amidotransferase A subunit family amidase